ncbi:MULTISPECIES: ParB/RepB/Spo0J family partition protein [Noviherbaspirillum]|uniref:ParB/RepB/Spo0J family partition protein n=1 Tax=Noviherbaspirillum TaxID=1344552 RepID=UPI00124D3464|nr:MULTISPECIES: ParB/RepB/Spo0J family partition protein [Noviherbaspirillum]
MTKPGFKFSGMINSGTVKPPENATPSLIQQAVQAVSPAPEDVVVPPAPAAAAIVQSPSAAANEPAPPQGTQAVELQLDMIDVSPNQPRVYSDDEELKALTESIAMTGVRFPISVRILESGRFEILAGHRRFAAAIEASKKTGKKTIPAYVHIRDAHDALLDTITENENRVNLTDYERALALQKLAAAGLKQMQMIAILGVSQATVSLCLNMLELPASIQAVIARNPKRFSSGTAKVARELLKKYPGELGEKALLTVVSDIVDGKLLQQQLRSSVEFLITPPPAGPAVTTSSTPRLVISDAGAAVFSTHAKPKDRTILVKCEDKRLDVEEVERIIRDALQKAVREKEENPKNQQLTSDS